ncbi:MULTISPECIES: WXG100 family type VII secretion target [unclassified Streptomyces]|uniref:WXG100 family type VII secretion target n=1 Tax=unclassified Streptomyces TaxID=2593676 RepID=UPI001BE5871D|nr:MULTISPECIES: hypothetical protein [unclassified Streptomyces]MBT2404648.1 hypothetical protein [Streptomyces sp. ISL-21]MBT2610452.1 hypothetical protein [Streptomyces sp. ISL-87]
MATSFEGHSLEQLMAMIAAFDPETVKARGTLLTQAAADIKSIGETLKSHKVTGWEGEAAEAFQDWVSQAGSATLRLGEYSANGGKYMTLAAQSMVEAKQNMPEAEKVATAQSNLETAHKYHNDPDAQTFGREAMGDLHEYQVRAAQTMKTLSESYDQSAKEMDKAQAPTFPPPPGEFVPEGHDGGGYTARSGGGSGTGAGSSSSSFAPQSSYDAPSNEPGWAPVRQPQPDNTLTPTTGPGSVTVPGFPDREVGVGLDTVGTLPDTTLPPTTALPGPVGPGGGRITPGEGIPPLALPPITGMPKLGGGPGPFGPFPGPSAPSAKAGGIASLPPRDPGITGGRQVSSTGPGRGIPRGTVIGSEGPQTGRGMMGGMGGMGGVGGSHGVSGGSGVGRRLATEPGGVVGGRQPAKGGQPFTQGGSGLVRGAGAGPVAGTGSRNPGRRHRDQGSELPDYLTEDEETWQGDRRVVPPVID